MLLTWAAFAACAAAVFVGGVQVAKSGDVIAEKTGLGRTWVGVIMLASVTSLPEAVSGFSAVVVVDAPRLAVGDVVGSCAFNLLIIALLDATSRTAPILSRVSQGHVLAATFGIAMLGAFTLGVVAGDSMPQVFWVSTISVALILTYLLATRTIFFYEQRQRLSLISVGTLPPEDEAYAGISTRHAYSVFALNAGLIIVAASLLPAIGERIAEQTGLGQSFVGTLFIAMATSLPEVAVSLTAVRIGAHDLALGGLLGSNIFNLAILGFDDVLYLDGSILLEVPAYQLVMAGAVIVMAAITIIGLMLQPSTKPPYLAWDALAILGTYLAGIVLLYWLI